MRNKNDTLFAKCQYIRLKAELDAINLKMEENAPLEVTEKDNFGEKFVKRTKNVLFRDSKTKELAEKREKILLNIEKFRASNPKIDVSRITDEEFSKNVSALFRRDKFDVNRELLGVSIILDGDYEYVLSDDGLKKVSTLLYEDEHALFEIKKDLEKLYTSIRKKPFPSKHKAIIYGVGATVLAVYAAAVTGLGIAAAGAGAGVVTLYACLAGGALLGATYITLSETEDAR